MGPHKTDPAGGPIPPGSIGVVSPTSRRPSMVVRSISGYCYRRCTPTTQLTTRHSPVPRGSDALHRDPVLWERRERYEGSGPLTRAEWLLLPDVRSFD
ncbi:hypothetical protein EVAR_49278_1 [Eumeta japonica]|uniref:Uncharacterized protein n=1 Tax=Eumeta variegata TaxID=151549 RepID=A0A4C1XNA0_EUMVA|nr:hypothetical protein EVAR_49278_1 [Eumeta japonica]